mmetsp:Transcript_15554/g.21954  ORF Transcript_15554/g.21954 Transcript_15554/m.21954 type:complete len:762 (+) Transcript_15554:110-2395(+)
MATNKEATIFILDSSPSMNAPYPSSSSSKYTKRKYNDEASGNESSSSATTPIRDTHENDHDNNGNIKPTRLSFSKTAIEGMLCDLMIQSKGNEAGVIVLKTRETKHSMEVLGVEPQEQVDKSTTGTRKPFTQNDQESLSSADHDDNESNDGSHTASSNTTSNESQKQQRLPYSNITELGHDGIGKPTLDLIRQVRQVQSTLTLEEIQSSLDNDNNSDDDDYGIDAYGGDIVDGIIVAADAMYRRTASKKIQTRKIIIFTDACHAPVKVDATLLLQIIEGLRSMDCRLQVIGLDFNNSAEFHQPATESLVNSNNTKKNDTSDNDSTRQDDNDFVKQDKDDDSISLNVSQAENDDESQEDEGNNITTATHTILKTKYDVEKLLIRLARLTGGSVIAASTMQQIVDSNLFKRTPKSTRRKLTLYIAPQLSINVRISLLVQKANVPTLESEAVVFDDQSKPIKDGLGEIMTTQIKLITEHWNIDNQEEHVPEEDRTRGYTYGSDCIPMGPFDDVGFVQKCNQCIRIIGYMKASDIPHTYLIGPPSVVSSEDNSIRSYTALSAWSQALHTLQSVAICAYVKTKDADPTLGALLPFFERGDHEESIPSTKQTSTSSTSSSTEALSVLFMQLPYANDVQKLRMSSLEAIIIGNDGNRGTKANACDDLIDTLMLPDDSLQSEKIASPAIRAFYRTVTNRAIDPTCPPFVFARAGGGTNGDDDRMQTKASILDRARTSLDTFRKEFPLENEVETTDGGKPKKKTKFWSDA